MRQRTIGQPLDSAHPNPRRNPNRRTTPPSNPLVMGQVKLLRRGEPPTAFEEREKTTVTTDSKKSKKINKKNKLVRFWDDDDVDLYPARGSAPVAIDMKKKSKNKTRNKKAVEFWDGDDVDIYSTTCRIGPEPEMVPTGIGLFGGLSVESPPANSLPLPLSLLRRAVA